MLLKIRRNQFSIGFRRIVFAVANNITIIVNFWRNQLYKLESNFVICHTLTIDNYNQKLLTYNPNLL